MDARLKDAPMFVATKYQRIRTCITSQKRAISTRGSLLTAHERRGRCRLSELEETLDIGFAHEAGWAAVGIVRLLLACPGGSRRYWDSKAVKFNSCTTHLRFRSVTSPF